MEIKIISITKDDTEIINQMGQVIVDAFAENHPGAWDTLEEGIEESYEALEDNRICRVAVDDSGTVLGWIGGIPQYDGNVWELHPLAVSPNYQGKGVGRALITDFEQRVIEQGGVTIYLGTDDENEATSLSNVDLYDKLWEHITNIRNIKGHAFEFYQKMDYQIVGVVPDANGIGRPDIMMAKRVGKS